jgi:non-specific serine/threonine protein kinase
MIVASKLSLFLAELKRRKVYRVAAVYAAVGVAISLGVPDLFGAFDLPSSAARLVILLIVIGFPVALILAWAYEVKPEEPSEAHRAVESAVDTSEPVRRTSIVVLPFDNMSPDPGDAYFADGLTEEIITNLSHIRTLRVISRSSAMVLKGTQKDVRTIGRELDVQYVLEGSVRKAGDDLRITAQLIDARDDTHLWAEKYDGVLEDVFGMQEKVARGIGRALQIELAAPESERVADRRFGDMQTYDYYLRARGALFRGTSEGQDEALRYMLAALDLAPENPVVLGGLAFVYAELANSGGRDREEDLARAEEFATRALELDPEIPSAHFALAYLNAWLRGDYREAGREFEIVMRLDPSDWVAQWNLALFYMGVGRMDAARKTAEWLVKLNPYDPFSLATVGYLQTLEGQEELGLETLQRAGLDRSLPWHLLWETWSMVRAGRRDEALALLESLDPDQNPDAAFLPMCLLLRAALRDDGSAASALPPEFTRETIVDPHASWWVAGFFSMAGEGAEALEWIEHAVERGFINYPLLSRGDPLLENIRCEERFQQLMTRVRHDWENL